MAKFYEELTEELRNWALKQQVFFVASAPLFGEHVNVSPKGLPASTFTVLDSNTACYIDATGSGAETIAHVYETKRATIMFCSFDKTPRIMRLFCTGRVIEYDQPGFGTLLKRMGKDSVSGARAVILLNIFKVQTSCGYAVPLLTDASELEANHDGVHARLEDRKTLGHWASKQVEKGELKGYQAQKNSQSLDGLGGLKAARRDNASDRRYAMRTFAKNYTSDPVDVIIGDWLSEANMTTRAASKSGSQALSAQGGNPFAAQSGGAFEPTFIEALDPALVDISKHGIKVVANAGASDTELLFETVRNLVRTKGLDLKVAWISGDEVLPAVKNSQAGKMSKFENICTGEVLAEWKFEPIAAQAYLGGLGIARALAEGADIVVCGRVSDASLVVGAAYWWHDWRRNDLNQLANALVAGHLIECSNYVCGGNFSGFKSLRDRRWEDIGYPIAEISAGGEVVVTKNKGSGGEVSPQTCSSQLLYEIQGPWYFNSDVTAILDSIAFEQLSTDRVALRGVKADLPPPTTKIGITAKGGYQAEMHWFMTGLDIDSKAAMMEAQIRKLLQPHVHRFSKLAFTTIGSVAENPTNQNSATAYLRVLAQAPTEEDLMPQRFLRPAFDPIMQGYPGATPHTDVRQAFPKPVYEYYVTLLPQADVKHEARLCDGRAIEIPAPARTKTWPAQQPTQPVTQEPCSFDWGKTIRGPLGWIVHGRSGDKGSNCNVGLFVRHQDEWDWLRSLLSVDRMKELLAEEYNGKKIASDKSLEQDMLYGFANALLHPGSFRASEHVRCTLFTARSSR
ncbi:hypothetical protein MBLNU459_g1283t2 [Dothideomycetes sp. NU459]